MQHKLLLGSTALVSAGILLAGASPAQADIEVVLGGYTEFGVKAATDDTLDDDEDDRHYLFFMDNEVFINAYGVTEGGIEYGSEVELEVGSGDGNTDNAFVDEVGLFASGVFGRIELGREDGAEDVGSIGGEDAQAGTGGIDGDTENLLPFEITDTGDNAKVTYFTPRVAGFQLGASWTPDNGDGVEDATTPGPGNDDQENIASGAVNWVGALGPLDLTVAGAGILGENEDEDEDDLESWEAGVLAGFGGFSVGAKYGQETDFNEGDFINAGLKYGFGAANVSVGYVRFDPDEGEEANLFAVSGDVGLMPGVVLKADVTYNDEDPFAEEGEDDTDDTIAGVLTVQLNY